MGLVEDDMTLVILENRFPVQINLPQKRHRGVNGYDAGYYNMARQGFNAVLPRDWLETHREDLAKLGTAPRQLWDLMDTEEGRKLWRMHGRTLDVRMDLRPGSEGMARMAKYLEERRRGGRAMAESKPADEPEYPLVCKHSGIILYP